MRIKANILHAIDKKRRNLAPSSVYIPIVSTHYISLSH